MLRVRSSAVTLVIASLVFAPSQAQHLKITGDDPGLTFLRGDAADPHLSLQFDGEGAFSGRLEHWFSDTDRLWYDGGDWQAFSSSLATFVYEGEDVAALDLGRMGRLRRERQ